MTDRRAVRENQSRDTSQQMMGITPEKTDYGFVTSDQVQVD